MIREELAALRAPDGSLPGGFHIPSIGSFHAGADYEAAAAHRNGGSCRVDAVQSSAENQVCRGRIAVVTGAAQGFGAEIARGLAERGAFVFAADIDANGVQAFADELNSSGFHGVSAIKVDVGDESSIRNMAEAIVTQTGGLDLVVSNAGILKAGSVLEQNLADFDLVTRVNYTAFFLMTRYCATLMAWQRAGAPSWWTDIIQVNSKSGLEGSNKNAAYAGGKFGGIGLVQSFALELVEYGIKVNAVCPGNFFDGPLWSNTERGLFVQYLKAGKVSGAKTIADVREFYESKIPMKRGCRGEDVLKAILYCVEQKYETGQALPVTGGQVMLR
ncbi:MAG: short-chain dehydrogenase [spirochete symbiont of Stewartia floridana]|nr:MAG: short-chain dehydrogenase [spirochete symbiont of Stewartia floridana]